MKEKTNFRVGLINADEKFDGKLQLGGETVCGIVCDIEYCSAI